MCKELCKHILDSPKICMPGKREEPVEAEANLRVVSTVSGTDSHISACTPLLGADTFSEACAENWLVYL